MQPQASTTTTAPRSLEQLQPRLLPGAGGAAVEVWPVGNRVGESPAWHAAHQALYWIDVRAQQVLCLEPGVQRLTRWHLPEVVGAMAPWGANALRLALRQRIVDLDVSTGALRTVCSLAAEEPEDNRLNDGKRSPSGRWFVVGSMDDRPDKAARGCLYCIGPEGGVRTLHRGLVVANGIAWSPDATLLYFSDSARGMVWQACWDEATGTMGAPRVFTQLGEAEGRPDGAQVDDGGRYWSAGVSAGTLNVLDATGARVHGIALPCRAPTMCAFGADGDLWVTSLVRPGWEPGPCDGALLRLPGAALW